MKKIIMITTQNCAYCKKAKNLLSRIYLIKPQYASIYIEMLEPQQAEKRRLHFKNIPAFFIENERVFEGYPTIEKLTEILEAAYLGQSLSFSTTEAES